MFGMFGTTTTRGRSGRPIARPRHVSSWNRKYLRKLALADLGCGIVGVFIAAEVRFGGAVTNMYVALSLALPLFWLIAICGWRAGTTPGSSGPARTSSARC